MEQARAPLALQCESDLISRHLAIVTLLFTTLLPATRCAAQK